MGTRHQRWMPFWQPFLMAASKSSKTRVAVELYYFICIFFDLYKTPSKSPQTAPSDGLPRIRLERFIESMP
jgi:hypothetical protein